MWVPHGFNLGRSTGRAADVLLDSLCNLNAVRNYGSGVAKTAERLVESRPLASVADE